MTVDQQLHPGEDVLERYSLGHLSEGELERVEEHLFVCERCQDELVHTERFIAEIKSACQQYRLQPEPERETLLARLSRLLAVPGLVYGGALAAILLACALPLVQYQADRTAPDTVSWNVTYRDFEASGLAEARAKRPLHLEMNIADLPPGAGYRIQIVNQDGRPVWTGAPSREGSKLVVRTTESLGEGIYWVRLYGSGNDPLREFGLRLH